MCSVWTENYRNKSALFYFILFIKLIRYVSFSSEDFRAFSEYLEGPEDSLLINTNAISRETCAFLTKTKMNVRMHTCSVCIHSIFTKYRGLNHSRAAGLCNEADEICK